MPGCPCLCRSCSVLGMLRRAGPNLDCGVISLVCIDYNMSYEIHTTLICVSMCLSIIMQSASQSGTTIEYQEEAYGGGGSSGGGFM